MHFDAIGVPVELRDQPYHNIKVGAGYLHTRVQIAANLGYADRDLLAHMFAGYNGGPAYIGREDHWTPALRAHLDRYFSILDRACPNCSAAS